MEKITININISSMAEILETVDYVNQPIENKKEFVEILVDVLEEYFNLFKSTEKD